MNGSPAVDRWRSVDALRGVAVLAVITAHCAYTVPAVGPLSARLLQSGQFGVDLFFVISGFVLCAAATRRDQRSASGQASAVDMLQRRWLRLWPLYVLGILFYDVLWSQGSWVPTGGENIAMRAANVLLVNGWLPGLENRVVPGGWSISAEAMWAILFSVGWRWWKRPVWAYGGWVVSTLLVAVAGRSLRTWLNGGEILSPGATSYFVVEYIPTFFAGMVVWHLLARKGNNGGNAAAPGWRAMAAVFGSAVVIASGLWGELSAHRYFVVALGCAALLWTTVSGPPQGRWWSRPLELLGRWSYGVYLAHFVVIEFVEVLVVGLLPALPPAGLLYALLWSITVLISLPLAVGLETMVDPRGWRRLIARLRRRQNHSV